VVFIDCGNCREKLSVEVVMKKYKVISIDLFQTLVNIAEREETIWKRILKEKWNHELQDKYVRSVTKTIVNNFHEVASVSSDFKVLKEIFRDSFNQLLDNDLGITSEEATDIFLDEHNEAPWYDDSLSFIEKIKSDYKVCLLSDADYVMVERLIPDGVFDHVILSEAVGSYKRNDNGLMFKQVLSLYGCKPNEVLHIGDSSSDVLGAYKQGIDTCWINRHNYPKRFNIEATYSVTSLNDMLDILL